MIAWWVAHCQETNAIPEKVGESDYVRVSGDTVRGVIFSENNKMQKIRLLDKGRNLACEEPPYREKGTCLEEELSVNQI